MLKIEFMDRKVTLKELRQSLAYEGLLEGLPTTDLNQRIIDRVLQDKDNARYGVQPFLVPPIEKPIEVSDDDYPEEFGKPSSLPSILCVARFESHESSSIGSGDCSGLMVIWFQQDFAMPIDAGILRFLSRTNWAACAGSYDY